MRLFVCVLSVALVGCGGRRAVTVMPEAAARSSRSPRVAAAQAPADSLETFMAKVRRLSSEARPEGPSAVTVEGRDPALSAALAAAVLTPSPVTYRTAAGEYRRLGIMDKAFQYLGKAGALDSRDAATHDALARLWRDSGFPELGLSDASRATYFAPHSPVAHNTLGTIFQALGRRALARREYERALELDPSAAYALNNLCYTLILEGSPVKAISACEDALRLQPGLVAARNNLGLARVVAGDTATVGTAFSGTGDRAAELFNTGLVYLAQGDYGDAIEAFESAQTARPTLARAAARARQARAAKASSLHRADTLALGTHDATR